MMSRYEKAALAARKAEAEAIACLFEECCEGDPYVQDENGNWMTKEEVAKRMRENY